MSIGTRENVIRKSGIELSDLKVGDQNEFNIFLDWLLNEATELVQAYTRRVFTGLATTTEKFDGHNRRTLRLTYYPAHSITSVHVGDVLIDPSNYRIQKNVNMRGENAGILEHKHAWPKGWDNITVVYSHGYVTPPADIVQVVEGIAVDSVIKALKEWKQSGADSITMDGFTATFNPRLIYTEDRMRLLDEYRIIPMG